MKHEKTLNEKTVSLALKWATDIIAEENLEMTVEDIIDIIKADYKKVANDKRFSKKDEQFILKRALSRTYAKICAKSKKEECPDENCHERSAFHCSICKSLHTIASILTLLALSGKDDDD